MKKYLQLKKMKLALGIMAFSFALNVQAQNFSWAIGMGGTSLDNGLSVTADAAGNVYTTGYFQGTADFDPGAGVFNLTSAGSTDIFISKVNSSGNLVWVKQIGGTGGDVGRSIKVDPAGNVYITGQFSGSVDFNPGAATLSLTSAGSNDIFVCKLDVNGNLAWAVRMGSLNNDYGYSLVLDAALNVYTTGVFEGTVDFDPGATVSNLTSAGGLDVFVCKLSFNGNFGWARSMGSSAIDFGFCIALDANSNVFTSGYFQGTADFDPGAGTYTLASVNARDIFISKLDGLGNFVWAKQIGGGGDQAAYSLGTDAAGNIYATGSFAGATDFDPGSAVFNLNTTGADDIFICKLNPSGLFGYAKSIGSSTGFDYGRGIAVDASGNVFATGEFDGTADFDPGVGTYTLDSGGGTDCYISKLDASGNFAWAKNIGDVSGTAYGNAIATDAAGNIYTSGYYSGTCDFDPSAGVFSLTPPGTQADVFVLKMTSCVANASPVNTTPMANLTRCKNESTTLSATGTGTINWYSSPTSTTIVNTGLSFGITLASAGTFTYYATTTNSCGAESNKTSFVITVKPLPTINVISNNPLFCIGGTANLSATGGIAYFWTPGGNGFSITVSPTVTTTYSVNGLGSNGCSGSTIFTQSVTICDGINQLVNNENSLSVFPNPATGFITIQANTSIQSLNIFNVQGTLVKTETQSTFSVEDLSKGIYLIQIKTENGIITRRFVKE